MTQKFTDFGRGVAHSSGGSSASPVRARWRPASGRIGRLRDVSQTLGPDSTSAADATSSTPGRWMRLHARLHSNPVTGLITKIVVSVIGLVVIIAGLVMMVAPGPGIVAVILGLAILSTEWAWADTLVKYLRRKTAEATHAARTMDPAVRRRRVFLVLAVTALALGAICGYVAWQDWPQWTVSGWDKVQNLSGVVPELPGM